VVLFAGDALAGGTRAEEWLRARVGARPAHRHAGAVARQEHADARTLDEFFDALGAFGVPVMLVPGDLDAPERLFMQAATNHELIGPNVHCVHRSFAPGPRNHAVVGFGGLIGTTERESELVLEYPAWEAKTGLDFVRHIERDRVLLVHTPPRFGDLDLHAGEHVGHPVVEEIIHTLDPRLVVCGHAMDGQGRAVVGDSLVVNPGPLCLGRYALVDLRTRQVSYGQLAGAEPTQSEADRQLQASVERAIAAEPATHEGRITVTVREGVAHLLGTVKDILGKAAAERAAASVEGVRRVENALTADSVVEARVTARLADDPRTALAPIDVAAIAGEVTLVGAVPSQAAKEAAEQIARSVPGVRLVVNELVVRAEHEPELATAPPAALELRQS
jgi:osmotically-inducible protein OsmY/Icc-related predicted phosphoesterase